MKQTNDPFRRIWKLFQTYPIPSLLVTCLVLGMIVTGILWGSGAFAPVPAFTYLPDREYILAPDTPSEPKTLKELLHSDTPDADILLKNPSIARELAQAEKLTDIVDSRLALNNLRTLDQQLAELLNDESMIVLDFSDESEASVAGLEASPDSSDSPDQPSPSFSPKNILILEEQRNKTMSLKSHTERLLKAPELGQMIGYPPTINVKGVWQSPDEALIHMVPSGDWLPEQGYKLYRVVNGQKTLIAEKLASPEKGLRGELKVLNADMIQELYKQADLSSDKLKALGMSADDFRNMAYRTFSSESKPRVNGEIDFLAMKQAMITVPAGYEQKIPETDRLLNSSIIVLGSQLSEPFTGNEANGFLWKKYSVNQANFPTPIDTLKLQPAGETKFSLAQQILAARQQISTLAFVNDEFAEAAGFLVRDDLSELNLPDGTQITYSVEMPAHANKEISVTKGVENNLTQPQKLLGYGIDGTAHLRWAEAESQQEKSILSGYHIERRLDGEKEFKKITDTPVVITYILDETNLYFQSPVFYEDTVDNGRTAEYRIYSIDIFGRRSEYSEILTVNVEKVTPPNAPTVEAPHFSNIEKLTGISVTSSEPEIGIAESPMVQLVQNANPGLPGVILPIFTDSPDTVRFTVYRATAVGAGKISAPEAVADIEYDNPKAGLSEEEIQPQLSLTSEFPKLKSSYRAFTLKKGLSKNVKYLQLTNPESLSPDMIFLDTDIVEGCTYKYWVSAWDSWNNESAWSRSVTMAVPTNAEPGIPDELYISMHQRQLIDTSAEPPGLLNNATVSFADLENRKDLPFRPVPAGSITETIESALTEGVTIGSFVTASSLFPSVIDFGYNNLPEDKYIHAIIAIRGEDVYPDGTARLKWTAYSGESLGGYIIYKAQFKMRPLEEIQQMSQEDILRMGRWKKMNTSANTQNQVLISGLNPIPGSLYLFLVCLQPDEPEENMFSSFFTTTMTSQLLYQTEYISHFLNNPEGGYVYIDWDVPDDPQVDYYRVYRSEVPSFKEPIDESKLEWTLVADLLENPKYTERVDQSFAHYYYYKVTTVSPWGVESGTGAVQRFRVPSTKPPQTPNLLLPLQTKDGVKVQFSAVSHCDRYEIYRAVIPKLGEKDISELLNSDREVHEALFSPPSIEDTYLTDLLNDYLFPGSTAVTLPSGFGGSTGSSAAQNAVSNSLHFTVSPITKLKTITQFNVVSVIDNLKVIDSTTLRKTYKNILEKYGPLAFADYIDLSENMMRKVKWEKIGEVPSDYNTTEEAGPLGNKPLSFTDTTAMYGVRYLYTVQAWNEDNLGSSRPEPVEATPRRNRPFDPIDGLIGEIDEDGKVSLSWNTPKMYPLTPEKCLEDTVGYIVYRSDTADGIYYQASPLLFDNKWTDEEADPYAFNRYKVKVLDTGGYLSEFSQAVLVRKPTYVPSLVTVIPSLDILTISFDNNKFSITEGEAFETAYSLSGLGDITVSIKVTGDSGLSATGFSIDQEECIIRASRSLAPGTYYVTATAKNEAGETSASFTLTVQKKTVIAKPEITFEKDKYTVSQGDPFETVYSLTGTEPINITMKAVTGTNLLAGGFAVNPETRKVTAESNLKPGSYLVTVTAKNEAGEASASFTLTVSEKLTVIPPFISFDGNDFHSTEGEEFSTVYELIGTKPVTVTLKAVTADGKASDGFVPDQASYTIRTEKSLKAGIYHVTVTAKNEAGETSASFTLTVSEKPSGQAPVIAFDGDSFHIVQGDEFGTVYELSGTEPVTVTVSAKSADTGKLAEGFSVDQSMYLVKAGPDLPEGTYIVTVTAQNAAGQSSVSFTLTVRPRITAPKLSEREDNYNFKITTGSSDFKIQLYAEGTEPLRWSLRSSSSRLNTLPSEVSIDNNGLLTVKKEIKAGTYGFIVRVENEAGADERAITLTVTALLKPFSSNGSYPSINNSYLLLSGTSTQVLSNITKTAVTTNISPTPGSANPGTFVPTHDYETDLMKCMGFDLLDVKLDRAYLTDFYIGTARLDIGYDTPINVSITNAQFEDGGGASFNVLTKGTVYLTEPVYLESIGLTMVSLDFSPNRKVAKVSGYLESRNPNQNLAGSLYVLEFHNAKLSPGKIQITNNLPRIRYKQFTFEHLNDITILLGASGDPNQILLEMTGDGIYMKSHLETLSNKGLQFENSVMRFDMSGKMDAEFSTSKEQFLQLLVPGGAGLRIQKAELRFVDGEVKKDGKLYGKLVIPFEKASAGGSLVPAVYAGGHPAHSTMDDLAEGDGELTDGEMVTMGDVLVHYGEVVQQNSLLILPSAFSLQDKCASVPITLNNWDGEGFMVESSEMDPVRVTNRNVSGGSSQDGFYIYTQRAQAVIVYPSGVSLDLSRDAFLPGAAGSQSQGNDEVILTPKETHMPFWTGIVIKGGKLELPSAYLKQENGGNIEFELAEGEMIYDLNGFNYQTYMYSSDPDGVPASFGDNLGGFKDVRIQDCLLDMYANRVNLEVHARVRVDLFHHNWVEAKLYTDEKGKFICSVAPTLMENGFAEGMDLAIDGGFFEPEGLRISGKIVLPKPGTEGYEIGSTKPLAFSDLIVPSDLNKIREQTGDNPYGTAFLDKAVTIDFKGFPMEIRSFDISYTAPKNYAVPNTGPKPAWMEVTLQGATQLSDTIPLSDETTDLLTVKCADEEVLPQVLFDKTFSVLKHSFDGCIDVTGKLIPKKIGGASGAVEYETDTLVINFLGQNLQDLPVTHYARFGKADNKFYFAIGLTPKGGAPINFGAGNIEKFTGLIAQNMQIGKDAQGKLTFPDKAGEMENYIKNLQPGGGKFAGGIKGEMTVIKLCTIKNLYFGFEPGPKVTAGGNVYMPLDIESIVNGNPTRHMGEAVIQYRHTDRYFSFNMTFDRVGIVLFDFSGSMGMEYSPKLFGVRIGYPETLATNFQLGPFPVRVGMGLGFRIDQENESMVQAKLEFGLEKNLEISIVYLHGYIYAGADGAYYWGGPHGNRIVLDLYLKGGINGGIRAFGKRYDIISFYLDAHGTLASGNNFKSWELGCRCTVGYSLDLWLTEIEGSVTASFDTTIG